MEMPGIEPGASYMQSMRSTTELHPHRKIMLSISIQAHIHTNIHIINQLFHGAFEELCISPIQCY